MPGRRRWPSPMVPTRRRASNGWRRWRRSIRSRSSGNGLARTPSRARGRARRRRNRASGQKSVGAILVSLAIRPLWRSNPDQPLRNALRDRLVTVQHAELAHEIGEMKSHRALGDAELEANLGAGHSVGRELQALPLARGQRRAFELRCDPLLDHAPDEQLMEILAEEH